MVPISVKGMYMYLITDLLFSWEGTSNPTLPRPGTVADFTPEQQEVLGKNLELWL